jgi:hypothetical protein
LPRCYIYIPPADAVDAAAAQYVARRDVDGWMGMRAVAAIQITIKWGGAEKKKKKKREHVIRLWNEIFFFLFLLCVCVCVSREINVF